MFYFVIVAWVVGCIVNYIHGNVKLPSVILVVGVAATVAQFTIGLGYGYIVIMAVLNIIIWFSNKLETV